MCFNLHQMKNFISLSPWLLPSCICLYMPIDGSICLCISTMQRFSVRILGSPNWPCAFVNSETLKILMSLKFDKGCYFFFIVAQLLVGWHGCLQPPGHSPDVLWCKSVPHIPLLSSSTFCTPALIRVVMWCSRLGTQQGGSCVLKRRKEMRNSVLLSHFIHNWKLTLDYLAVQVISHYFSWNEDDITKCFREWV